MGIIRSALYASMFLYWRWRPQRALEFRVVFQNLLDPQHQDFSLFLGGSRETEVKRSLYGEYHEASRIPALKDA